MHITSLAFLGVVAGAVCARVKSPLDPKPGYGYRIINIKDKAGVYHDVSEVHVALAPPPFMDAWDFKIDKLPKGRYAFSTLSEKPKAIQADTQNPGKPLKLVANGAPTPFKLKKIEKISSPLAQGRECFVIQAPGTSLVWTSGRHPDEPVGLAKSKRNKSKQIFCFKERKISLKVTDHTQPVMDAGWVPQSDGGKPANDSVCLEE